MATRGRQYRPMLGDQCVKIRALQSLAVSIRLQTCRRLHGMGLHLGFSFVVGRGFHDQSTLLAALQVGVLNHVPGKGREFVSVRPVCVSIFLEDSGFVACVDITSSIVKWPFGRSTDAFCTQDTYRSTSQAANTVDTLDAGATLFLTDEDLSVTNSMMGDTRTHELVPPVKEPITPMIRRIPADCTRGQCEP